MESGLKSKLEYAALEKLPKSFRTLVHETGYPADNILRHIRHSSAKETMLKLLNIPEIANKLETSEEDLLNEL